MSRRELKVPTNTGRLAARALTNSYIVIHGDQARPFDLREHLLPRSPCLLLYPSDDAELLTPQLMKRIGLPINLIVPDGNWRQTSKMRRRIPHLADIPIVKVPAGPATSYRVRKETKAEGLATLEAIARAMAIIEGPHVQLALEELLKAMVERVLSSRGTKGNALPQDT